MPTYTKPAKYRLAQRSVYTDSRTPNQLSTLSSLNTEYDIGYDVVTQNSNPDYRQIIARGGNASTDYTLKKYVEVVPCVVTGRTRSKPLPYIIEGFNTLSYFGSATTLINPADDTALRDLALARLKRKLASNTKQMNLVVPLVELSELHRTIGGVTGMATDLIRDLIAIRKTRGKSAMKYAARTWLNFSFGVRPLLKDVSDTCAAIEEYLNRRDRSIRLTGTASKTWLSYIRDSGMTGAMGASVTNDTQMHHTLSYRYTAGFDINLLSANNYGLDDQLGLQFGNLVPAFWELTPYSWVVDYFTTVGAYLEDTFLLPPGNSRYVVLNKRYIANSSISAHHVPTSEYYLLLDKYKGGKISYVEFSRTSLASLPRTSLRFKTLDEIGFSAVNKLLNLSSVFISNSRRGR